MQFLVLGHDGADAKALERRLAARDSHLALGDTLREAGRLLYAAAILDEKEKMVGSVLICEFNSRQDLDDWLKIEPYVIGKVWEKIEIRPCKVGSSFYKVH